VSSISSKNALRAVRIGHFLAWPEEVPESRAANPVRNRQQFDILRPIVKDPCVTSDVGRDAADEGNPPTVLVFGENRLDLESGELWRAGRRVRVRRKAWQVLVYLIERPGRLVTKDELLSAVWPGVNVNEEAVARHVREVRQALGDTSKPATCIEVEYGRGFKFVASIRPATAAASPTGSGSKNDETELRAEVWRALGVQRRSAGKHGENTIVGRADDLAAIDAALRQVVAGGSRLIEFAGEAGLGKTRIVADAIERALGAGFAVLVGRCFEGEGRPPFWPWAQAIRFLLRRFPVDTVRRWLGEQSDGLAQILPEFGPQPAVGLDPEQARLRLFDTVVTLLRHAGRHQPLLLVLDDVHWADPASIALLQTVAYESALPLLIIVTRRPGEPEPTAWAGRVFDRLQRDGLCERRVLQGLDLEQTAALLADRAGTAVAADLVRSLWQRTRGNPYFLEELWRDRSDPPAGTEAIDRDSARDSDPIPAGVRSALGQRIERLSPPTQAVLAAASVQGVEFHLDAVAHVISQPEVDVLDALEEAAARGMVEELPGCTGRFRFLHTLTAEVLRADLSAARRARLHAGFGEWIETATAGGEDRIAEIAFHLTRSADRRLTDKAIDCARRAARQADAACAYETAALHLDRALQVIDAAGTATSEAALRRRYEILVESAECHERGGDGATTRARAGEAAELARRLGDATLAARAALVGGSLWSSSDAEVIQHLEDALVSLGDGEPVLRALLQARLARELYFQPHTRARREELCQQAQALAQSADDSHAMGLVLVDCLEALYHGDALGDLEMLADKLYVVAAIGEDSRLRMESHCWRIALSLQRGRLADAAAETTRLHTIADQIRRPRFIALAHTFTATLAIARGELDRAEEHVRAAAHLNQRIHPYHSSWVAFIQLFTIRREQGRADELSSDDQTIRPPGAGDAGFEVYARAARWQIPFALSEQGRSQEAHRSFVELMERLEELPPENARNARLASLASLVDVCASVGDAAAAAQLLPLVRPYEDQWVVIGFGAICGASVHNMLGMLEGVLGHQDVAEGHFATALAEHDRERAVVAQARTRHNYARMLLRRGGETDDAHRAQVLIRSGIDLATRHGLTASRRKLERLLG